VLARKTIVQHQDNCRAFVMDAFQAKQQRFLRFCEGEPTVFHDKTTKIDQIIELLGHGRMIKERTPT
jgi:hypothetical protein